MEYISESKATYSDKMKSSQQEQDPYEIGLVENLDGLKRRLSGRQIQMLAIGGSIGTALFVSISYGLVGGGSGSLLI
jgi:amino acid transporter